LLALGAATANNQKHGAEAVHSAIEVATTSYNSAVLSNGYGCRFLVQVRRVMYHYLLPCWSLAGHLFTANASGALERLLSPLTYFASRLLLPKAMAINAATAARGKQRLLEEFDFFDHLLLTQQQQSEAAGKGEGGSVAAGDTKNSNSSGGSSSKLPFYLCGADVTAADVSLAALAGYVVGISARDMGLAWSPKIEQMPADLRQFMQVMVAGIRLQAVDCNERGIEAYLALGLLLLHKPHCLLYLPILLK
jgi:hypothetical protein